MSQTIMTKIAPVKKTIEVNANAQTAFDGFVDDIGAWWPLETHSLSAERQDAQATTATIERRVGGRIYETTDKGKELIWGEVLTFEPNRRILMSWRLQRDAATEVEVIFTPIADGRTRIDLTHSHWERWGENASEIREYYNSGWTPVLGRYATQLNDD